MGSRKNIMRVSCGGGTETTEGFIPHHKNSDGIYMPVKIRTVVSSRPHHKGRCVAVLGDNRYPVPERRDGKLVYVLPGGGNYIIGKGEVEPEPEIVDKVDPNKERTTEEFYNDLLTINVYGTEPFTLIIDYATGETQEYIPGERMTVTRKAVKALCLDINTDFVGGVLKRCLNHLFVVWHDPDPLGDEWLKLMKYK